jgi:hypothetical protein
MNWKKTKEDLIINLGRDLRYQWIFAAECVNDVTFFKSCVTHRVNRGITFNFN